MTLGCKVNQYETGAIESLLRDRGHESMNPGEGSDIVIINTCAVTAESVRKTRQAIRRMKKLEPNALIAVCGCYSQLEPEEVKKLGADIVSGTSDRQGFALKVESWSGGSPSVAAPATLKFEELPPGSTSNRTRALLKIQDGCNNFCTYCIVPYIRGRSRSLNLEKISEYAKQLENHGYKEIVITGIELSSYGKDLTPRVIEAPGPQSPCVPQEPLLTAIQTIHTAAPGARLRLGSLVPSIMTDDFCKELSKIPNLCNHFHLSLQSGCNETLKRMGRKYTADEVMKSIESIRTNFADCGITADLITGFPGETEEEFNQTLKFIETASFSDMHIFPYSERPGTKAAKMPNQLEKNIRKDRARAAAEKANKMAKDFKKSQIGKITKVLIEQEKSGFSSGHSTNYTEINIKGKVERNSIQNVKITALKNGKLYGEIV